MKATTIILALFLFAFQNLTAQFDPRFDQPGNSPLHYNAGFAGAAQQGRLALTYRNQWMGISGAPNTFYASYDYLSNALKGGVGGMAFLNTLGPLTSVGVSGVYSLKLTPGNKKVTIAPSVKVSLLQFSINGDWEFSGVIDPVLPISGSVMVADISPGFLMNTKNFFLGASVEHLLRPSLAPLIPGAQEDRRLNRRLGIQAGYQYQVNPHSDWSFSSNLFAFAQGPILSIQGSMNARYKFLLMGIGGNSDRDLIFFAGFKTKRVKATYSYALITSRLEAFTTGTHEASLIWYFPRKN